MQNTQTNAMKTWKNEFLARLLRPESRRMLLIGIGGILLAIGGLAFGMAHMGKNDPQISENAPSPSPTAVPTARPVMEVVSETLPPTASPKPTPKPSVTQTPSPSPTSVPTVGTVRTARWTETCMEFLFVITDGSGHPVYPAAVSVAGDSVSVLFVPNTVLMPDGSPLSTRTGADAIRRAFSGTVGLSEARCVTLDGTKLAACIDVLGSVSVDGKTLDGAAAEAYLGAVGAGTMQGIERAQKLLPACVARVREMRFSELLFRGMKLRNVFGGNLTKKELWELYGTVKGLKTVESSILPVHSAQRNGEHCYIIDAELAREVIGKG